ncbi:BadF/BadG/BcrA/BcrD ATPase family protein [Actinoplanes octamycinicus]|nr:N-acetylglucosamine kinase [Actinoplanes octamycinicus]
MVIGVDAGATTTRCVVATLDGVVAGRGRAGGANANSSGGEISATLGMALAAALDTVDRTAVRFGVLGAAGSAGAGRERFRAAARQAWREAGLGGEMATVTDLEVAFAAGTAQPDGVLLLAGTGALAARFRDGVLERRCDGYGWLLGDEGSAVWIGVRALRAALAALDGRGEPTTLVTTMRAYFNIEAATGEEVAQALLHQAFAVPPAELGRLAPLVSEAAHDPVAARICARAAGKLLHTYDSVGPGEGVTVIAGSVLLNPGPVSRAVRAGLLARTATPPRPALDGAAGAAALAVGRLTGTPVPPVVHARLTGSTHDPSRE